MEANVIEKRKGFTFEWSFQFRNPWLAVMVIVCTLGAFVLEVWKNHLETEVEFQETLSSFTVTACPAGSKPVVLKGAQPNYIGMQVLVSGFTAGQSQTTIYLSVAERDKVIPLKLEMSSNRGMTLCLVPDPRELPPQMIVGLIPASPEKEGQK